jgi:hypothetical protein
VRNALNLGNTGVNQVLVPVAQHVADQQYGMKYISWDGAVHHYVLGFGFTNLPFSSVGIDPFLRWEGGYTTIANSGFYGHMHNMYGMILPAWNIHFSHYSQGTNGICDSSSPAYCLPRGAIEYNGWSPWTLLSNWAAPWPSPWMQPWRAGSTPKIVVDFESHIPTIAGIPMRLQLHGTMQADWSYTHFSIQASATAPSSEPSVTIQVPPWQQTASGTTQTCVHVAKAPKHNSCTITGSPGPAEWQSQSWSITTPLDNPVQFFYPDGLGVSGFAEGFTPIPASETSTFPVNVTVPIRSNYGHLVYP